VTDTGTGRWLVPGMHSIARKKNDIEPILDKHVGLNWPISAVSPQHWDGVCHSGHVDQYFSPSGRRAYVLPLLHIFNDFCQTNYYPNIHRTDLHQILEVDRNRTVVVDERSVVIFSIPRGTLPWQPILWVKFRPNPQNWVRTRFARWRCTPGSASAALDAGESTS